MRNVFKTEQEQFWAGDFGNEYISRNQGEKLIASNIALFAKILTRVHSVKSVIEFGANIGLNCQAIRKVIPSAEISAIEINKNAVKELEKWGGCKEIYCQSILDFKPNKRWDFVFTKTVLIHINPDLLEQVYDLLYRSSNRYICIAEYYNPTPTEVNYRGHESRLFKRDFAGEVMERFKDVQLIDYGFVYQGDCHFPQDDITWFLLEKTGYAG